MARALSVGDGKPLHSLAARNPTGSDLGRVSLGYWAATLSGPEKSLQMRHDGL